ncbi:hypothetical protein D3C87_628520 [compost metagenome]
MRAYELYESGNPTATPLDFARAVLVPQMGFKEYTPDFMFVKYISDSYYITARCASYTALDLFDRNTMKSVDKLVLQGDVTFRTKHQILNKITEWTKQHSAQDPQL